MNSEFVYDTTLRDGEQMPGVVFSRPQKIQLAERMSELGVGIIGLMPAVSDNEREITEYLSNSSLDSQITAATMLRRDHIDLAYDCSVDRIILFSSVSDIHLEHKLGITRQKNLDNALEFVHYAKEKGLTVDFAGEDATRADQTYLVDFVNQLGDAVDYFLPCDTMGVLTPNETYDLISLLKKETDSNIGLHIHNDYGCATANTLSGIVAGADLFSGTFTGIGERSGNVAIEEVLVALWKQYGMELSVNYEMLGEICDLVEEYSGVEMSENKPIVGENAYSHESGIHVDGVLKHPPNYENYDPKEVGRKRIILYGKKSGVNSLKHLFGKRFTDKEYEGMLQKIKRRSQEEQRSFSKDDVKAEFLGGE